MVGAVIILIVLVVAGPIFVMLGGALWTAVVGWFLVDDAERRAVADEAESS